MIQVVETRTISGKKLDELLFPSYSGKESSRIESSVRAIVDSVRLEGDRAVVKFTEKFDGVSLKPSRFQVEREEILSAYKAVSRHSLGALRRAYKKIISFHQKELRRTWVTRFSRNAFVGQKITAIERVGVYCPGGKAFYPSSVLMNIAPATVAGCSEIVMVSPPSGEGGAIHPGLLVAADIAGATQIYRIGGAQAIAALAYGTETIPKVDKIVGPGNIYVAVAKRLVAGAVAIDMEAGPSEIMIVGDSSADPRLVAADMLSQAEHDEMASAILVSTSRRLVREVIEEMKIQIEGLERSETIRKSLDRNGLAIVARGIHEAIDLANRRAPEHLELLVKNAHHVAERINNAGVIFFGDQTPNSVGDYFAGPNHVLPTGGRARFASPLTTEDFRKVTSLVKYSARQLRAEADDIIAIAELEGLTAHANAVRMRMER